MTHHGCSLFCMRFDSAGLRHCLSHNKLTMAKARARKKAAATSENIGKRWTPRLVRDGFTPIADFFLENYYRLAPPVSSLEAMFIIHLMRHKWDEKAPHPSFKTIARRMGVSDATTRAYARSLEEKRLLRRMTRDGQPVNVDGVRRTGETNRFDLTPLFDALERLHIADEAAQESANDEA